MFLMCVAVYSKEKEKGTDYGIEDIKKAFYAQNDELASYVNWYCHGGSSKGSTLYAELVDELGLSKLNSMTIEELEEYINNR